MEGHPSDPLNATDDPDELRALARGYRDRIALRLTEEQRRVAKLRSDVDTFRYWTREARRNVPEASMAEHQYVVDLLLERDGQEDVIRELDATVERLRDRLKEMGGDWS